MKTLHARLLSALLISSITPAALAQQSKDETSPPKSPNGRPMEAVFDYTPEAPNGKLTVKGPYLVSSWGGIVLRGRPEGDRVVTALSTIQCGEGKNPSTEVTMLGLPPDDLCDVVRPLPPGREEISFRGKVEMLGQHAGWTVIEFTQETKTKVLTVDSGFKEGALGVSSLGAVYFNQNGQRVFFAPGETVTFPGGGSFAIKPAMTVDELRDAWTKASATKQVEEPAARVDPAARLDNERSGTATLHGPPPVWFYLLFFGTPLAVIGGAIYWIVRRVRRRPSAVSNTWL